MAKKGTGNGVGVLSSKTETEVVTRKVVLCGLTEIMFDRYAGDNKTQLEAWQKFYLGSDREIQFPSLNILSFLSAHNTNSSPKRLRDKRTYKDVANACLSFVQITPQMIPFVRNEQPIHLGRFEVNANGIEEDRMSDSYIARHVARLDKGIPNPKVRPVLRLPWELRFQLTIFPNREIKEQEIQNLFEEGGRALGLGTFRGVFGKFRVEAWE